MKKLFYLVVAVAVVVLLVWLLNRPAVEQLSDTSTAIQQEVESLDLGDLDKEFQGIDADLEQL